MFTYSSNNFLESDFQIKNLTSESNIMKISALICLYFYFSYSFLRRVNKHFYKYITKTRYFNTFKNYDKINFDDNKFIRDKILSHPQINLAFDGFDNENLYFQDDKLNFNHLSDGLKKILTFIVQVYKSTDEVIMIEEPENHLHPSYQKKIPLILKVIGEIKKEQDKKVQFFVSTHSPFVINASGEFKDTQRVYLIEDGQCHNSDGYSGYNARTKAKEMLGYEENEFMPSKIIFCEETLVEFLTIINNRFYQKDIVFKRPKTDGGDATVLGVHKATELIKKACENVLHSDFAIILDTPSSNNEITLARNLQKNYPNSVIILNTSSFEKKFGQNPKEIENQQGGKKQNARNKANEIQNKQEFEMLFPELFGEGLSLF